MDKVLNLDILGNLWNWPRVWLMLAAGILILFLTMRALPEIVPTEA